MSTSTPLSRKFQNGVPSLFKKENVNLFGQALHNQNEHASNMEGMLSEFLTKFSTLIEVMLIQNDILMSINSTLERHLNAQKDKDAKENEKKK